MNFDTLVNIYLVFLFIDVLIAFTFYRKEKTTMLLTLNVYLVAMVLCHIVSQIFKVYYNFNLFFSHIYFFVVLCTTAFFYYTAFQGRVKQQRFILIYVCFYIVVNLAHFIIIPKDFWIMSYLGVFLSFYFVIICALLFIYNTIGTKSNFSLVNYGFLFYSFIACAHFLFLHLMTFAPSIFYHQIVLKIHLLALITFQILILISLLINQKKWTELSPSKK